MPSVGVTDMLDKIDPGVGRAAQSTARQESPVHPGKEEHIAAPRLPTLGGDTVSRRPEFGAFSCQQLVRGLSVERDSGRKTGHPHDVIVVVGMLDVPAVQAHVFPVKPHLSCHRPNHQSPTPTSRPSPPIPEPTGCDGAVLATRHVPWRIRAATCSQSDGRWKCVQAPPLFSSEFSNISIIERSWRALSLRLSRGTGRASTCPSRPEQGKVTACDQLFVPDDILRCEVGLEASVEPVEDDELTPQHLRLLVQRAAEFLVELLARRNASPMHRQVHRLPGCKDGQGIAHQGETRKGLGEKWQDGCEQRIVLDDQGKPGGQWLPDRNLAPFTPGADEDPNLPAANLLGCRRVCPQPGRRAPVPRQGFAPLSPW